MESKKSLADAMAQTQYQLPGHGNRNVQVLKDAFNEIDGQTSSDMYGKGAVIEAFQQKMATFLGKEAAVFFPSGTMAQQIALRIWCDRTRLNKVAYHPLCHLEIHEENGLKMLHHIESVLLADKDSVIQLEDVVQMKEDVTCVLLELPQREIGGQLPEYETLVAISSYCRGKGIKLHLDGARLYEILPYYQKTATEVCALFDSVYVSLYKGIGGIAGAILAGDKIFIDESIVWKRRHGGDLISLYPYILSADYYFNQRVDKMGQYYDDAKELAPMFHISDMVWTRPHVPVSNMFHVHFHLPKEKVEAVLMSVYEATDVGFTGNLREVGESECYFELSIGDQYRMIPKALIERAFEILRGKLQTLPY